jgi:MinD superfamily P-loop ATPase
MRQLLVLSGKGGTGKTSVASSFIKLSSVDAYADCDVDAPNLMQVVPKSGNKIQNDFYGMKKAKIDNSKCISCNRCLTNCKFDAITNINSIYSVDTGMCESCSVCQLVCPTNAITMEEHIAGELILYKDERVFSTAKLRMGSGTSGKLVTEVKRQLKDNSDSEIAIIDGSPGIGCPVISSISGVEMVLVVTEPSLTGLSDMKRIITLCKNFKTKVAVTINKYDLNPNITQIIEEYCFNNSIEMVGNIPYDINAIKAINMGRTIVELECKAKESIEKVYKKTMEIFNNKNNDDKLFKF